MFMHTDEYPYRSPAAMVSVRPVTLCPYLSVSLPSNGSISKGTDRVKAYEMSGQISLMNGLQADDTDKHSPDFTEKISDVMQGIGCAQGIPLHFAA